MVQRFTKEEVPSLSNWEKLRDWILENKALRRSPVVWQAAFAAISGFLAKEVVVSTFAILAGLGEAAEEDPNLIQVMQTMFTPASAYAFMVFTLLASPCFAAIGAIRREMGSWKWTFAALAYQTGLAYIMATLIYQIGSRI